MDCGFIDNLFDALLPLPIGGLFLLLLFAILKSAQALVQKEPVFVNLRLLIFLSFAIAVLFFGGLALTYGCSFFASNFKSNLGPLLLSFSVPLFYGVFLYKIYPLLAELQAVRIPPVHALITVVSGGWMIAKGIILFLS